MCLILFKAAISKEAAASIGSGPASKTFSPHKADKSTTVTCVAAKSSSPGVGFVLSGSSDKTAILTSLDSGKVFAKLTGHTKKVHHEIVFLLILTKFVLLACYRILFKGVIFIEFNISCECSFEHFS